MLSILWITIPVYFIILLGYFSVRLGYLPANIAPDLGKFVIRVALPALIFSAIAVPEVDRGLDPGLGVLYLLSSLGGMIAGLLVARGLFGRSWAQSWILGLGTSLSNSGFLGYPIVSELAGSDLAARFFAIALVIENVVVMPLALVAADMSRSEPGDLRHRLREIGFAIFGNPILLGVIAAMAVRITGLSVPGPIRQAIEMLADVAPAMALFVVGATIAQYPVKSDLAETCVIAALKLVLHPALTLLALTLIPVPQSELVPIAILFAAMPMLSIFPILGTPFGVARLSAGALVVSTALSFVTVGVWAVVMGV